MSVLNIEYVPRVTMWSDRRWEDRVDAWMALFLPHRSMRNLNEFYEPSCEANYSKYTGKLLTSASEFPILSSIQIGRNNQTCRHERIDKDLLIRDTMHPYSSDRSQFQPINSPFFEIVKQVWFILTHSFIASLKLALNNKRNEPRDWHSPGWERRERNWFLLASVILGTESIIT